MIKNSLAVILLLVFGYISHQYLTEGQERYRNAVSGNIHEQHMLASAYWQQGNKTNAYYWWERAAQKGSVKAIHQLMAYFPQQTDEWLSLAAKAEIPSAINAVAKRELNSARFSLASWLTRWEQKQTTWLDKQRSLLNSFESHGQCDSTLAVIGHSDAQKSEYLRVLSALDNSEFELNWCSSWVVDGALECTLKGERDRAECNSGEQADYQIILADSGIASASSRQIVLTEHSSRAVIQHEIAHWLGLADEYPMSGALAKRFCQGLYQHKSLNVVVTDSTEQGVSESDIKALYQRLPWQNSLSSWKDIAQHTGQYWVLGSDASKHKVGLFKADTCNAEEGFQAWKPVKETTAMEQHATEYWPKVYLELIEAQSETAN